MKQSPSKQSESSENQESNVSIQYPNVVTDDDKKNQEKNQAAIRAHSARTAQLLKAQQQIRKGEGIDSSVINDEQKLVIKASEHVLAKEPLAYTSTPTALEQRQSTN